MDVRRVEEWSKGARDVLERGGEREESRYEPLVDSGSDPRAWLALVQPVGTCTAHVTSAEYLRHSPCPSTGSYHGENQHFHTHQLNYSGFCSNTDSLLCGCATTLLAIV